MSLRSYCLTNEKLGSTVILTPDGRNLIASNCMEDKPDIHSHPFQDFASREELFDGLHNLEIYCNEG